MPFISVNGMDHSRIVGTYFTIERIRIGFQIIVAPLCSNAVFIAVALFCFGNSDLPDTHIMDLLHGVDRLIPAVEISDYSHIR